MCYQAIITLRAVKNKINFFMITKVMFKLEYILGDHLVL